MRGTCGTPARRAPPCAVDLPAARTPPYVGWLPRRTQPQPPPDPASQGAQPEPRSCRGAHGLRGGQARRGVGPPDEAARAAVGGCRRRCVPRRTHRAFAIAIRSRHGETEAAVAHHPRCGWAPSGSLVRLYVRRHRVLLPGRARPSLGAGKCWARVDGNDDSARDSTRLRRVQLPARRRPQQTAVDICPSNDERGGDFPVGVGNRGGPVVARAGYDGGTACECTRTSLVSCDTGAGRWNRIASWSSCPSTPKRTIGTAVATT